MDGTVLFQCVTTLFMAQAYGINFSITSLLIITVTVVTTSIGTPAIPGGGVVILATMLQSSGIPIEGLLVIIGVDRILSLIRSTINVSGDLTASIVFDKFYGTNQIKLNS